MAWDFCTDPDVQARLDWADRFVAEEIEPVESLLYDVVDVGRPEGAIAALFEQWRQEVKDQNLYAAHLPVDQGGQGSGQPVRRILSGCSDGLVDFGKQARGIQTLPGAGFGDRNLAPAAKIDAVLFKNAHGGG